MKKVYIVYPEGGYGERRKTRNRLKAWFYEFILGQRELFTPGLPRRIVTETKFTNTY